MEQNIAAMSAAEATALVKEALSKGFTPNGDLQKAWVQSGSPTTGLTAYSLEAPAKTLYPVITPLRNKIPRVTGGTGIQANWRAVTKLNTSNISVGVGEGRRGGVSSTEVKEYYASFKTIGIEDSVTFEANLAAQGFDDVKARAVQGNLRNLMIGEERLIIGGLGTFGLGQVGTVTLSAASSGGALGNGTYYVRCVALSHEGYMHASLGTLVTGIRAEVTRTNADGTTQTFGGGSSRASASANTSVTGPNGVLSMSVTPVKGAVAYAWFTSTTSGNAADMRLSAVTTVAHWKMTAALVGDEQVLPADLVSNDRSQNALVFDGFLGLAAANGSGSYWKALDNGTPGTGTVLTGDGTGGITQIDEALAWYWDNLRISPTEMWVSGQESNALRKAAADGKANGMSRFVFTQNQAGVMAGGAIRAYINQYAMDGAVEVPIRLHPNIPPGTILFLTHEIPYALSGVTDVNRILCRQDYYSMEWPLRTRQYEYGVYSDEVLQCYFTPGIGVLTNIAKG